MGSVGGMHLEQGKIMGKDLKMNGRSLLTLRDVSDEEMLGLLDLADVLKEKRSQGRPGDLLRGKQIGMIFEKSSTRTRCAVSVAVADEGGHAEYLSSGEIHLGKKESVADTARVLGRMFHGLVYRGFGQAIVETLARCSGVPVWNGLTDDAHPTQALADLMTVRESFGSLQGLKVVYIGDGRNNVANSLMLGCAKAGVEFANCAPPELAPCRELVKEAEALAAGNGSTVRVYEDVFDAVKGANAVYTDVWVSMGEESKQGERIALLQPYQVNMDVMRQTGNLDDGKVIFLHCLPAFHDTNTKVTEKTGAQEVTDDVFEAGFSKVFDQAENRMHTIKALLVAALG